VIARKAKRQQRLERIGIFGQDTFYEKPGCELFATLEDYPEGHCKYFLKKTLDVAT
jgi:hypothetical protein